MKLRIAMIATTAAGVAALSGCGGSEESAAMSPPLTTPPGQGLVTSQVLAQARQASETAEPYAVNDGVVSLLDSSETTDPINIDVT
jgi:hypothetical protein